MVVALVMHCSKKSDARSVWVNKIKDTGGMIVMAMLLSGENYQKAA